MLGPITSVSVDMLLPLVGTPDLPVVIDVRRPEPFGQDPVALPTALRGAPDAVEHWEGRVPRGRPVVVYCVAGHEVSQGACAALRRRGIDASYLVGGLEAWKAAGGPSVGAERLRGPGDPPPRWITRERPKIDRIACPWLVRRFVDPSAEFLYVPAGEVLSAARETGAVPYDVPGVDFSHEGDRCSFDAFVARFGVRDPAVDVLAAIVRGADTGRLDLAPEAAGLLALSLGLSARFPDDHAMLAHGMTVYDALYAWARHARAETHGWPPQA